MRRKICVILIAFLCIFSMNAAVVHASEDVILNDDTGVSDKVLYRAILSALGKKDGETFTRQEAATVDWLSVPGAYVLQSLKGIGCLVNLEQLDMPGTSRIDGLEELKNLEALDVSFAGMTLKNQWKSLAKMKSLKYLTVDGCKLSSLKGTGIEKLTNLETFEADGCGLKKIDELKNLKNLRLLSLSDNRLTNIKALKGLESLNRLYLDGNRLNDVKEVQRFRNLERLNLSNNGLKHIPDLKKLGGLEELGLSHNYLTEKEIKSKVPQIFLKDKDWKKRTLLFQRNNAVIRLKSPAGINGITRNTKRISGKISLVPGYKNGYYVCLSNPNSSKYRQKRWKVNADGSFELNKLDLRSWAGDTVSLQVMVNPKLEAMDGWYEVNSITFWVKK